MRSIGVLIASLPVAFAVIRAATTRSDFRYFWLALASTVTAALMIAVARRVRSPAPSPIVVAALAVFGAVETTGITAFALGAGSAPAVAIVALGFAGCSGIGLTIAAAFRGGSIPASDH